MIYLYVYWYLFITLMMGGYWQSLWRDETNVWKSVCFGIVWPLSLPWTLGCIVYSLSLSVNVFLRSK
jgi:hypothetical protein